MPPIPGTAPEKVPKGGLLYKIAAYQVPEEESRSIIKHTRQRSKEMVGSREPVEHMKALRDASGWTPPPRLATTVVMDYAFTTRDAGH